MKQDVTICPKCGNEFSISLHRKYQIRRKYVPFWFIDAMNQFENFNEVICPYCEYEFKASDTRLFLFFKSPYSVVLFSLFFLILALLYFFMTLK